jgi:hypothetical protein
MRAAGEDDAGTKDASGVNVGTMVRRWHHPGATSACRLREVPLFAARRITVYNSPRACDWLMESGWIPLPILAARSMRG